MKHMYVLSVFLHTKIVYSYQILKWDFAIAAWICNGNVIDIDIKGCQVIVILKS